jgi:uncharacterized protein
MKVESLEDLDVEFVKYNMGTHTLNFVLNSEFFNLFETSSLQKGNLQAKVEFEKKINSLTFDINVLGNVQTECDRCLKYISIPIESSFKLIVKITTEPVEEDENLTFITPTEHKFNLGYYLYEMIHLAMPMRKVCDDIGEKCDEEVMSKINDEDDEPMELEKHPEFEKLKNIFKDIK